VLKKRDKVIGPFAIFFSKKRENRHMPQNEWNRRRVQGCQMVCFQTKNPNFGHIWRVLEWKMLLYFYDHLEYFTATWYNVWSFGVVCGHLVYSYVLVCLDQEKSGNPGADVFFAEKMKNKIALPDECQDNSFIKLPIAISSYFLPRNLNDFHQGSSQCTARQSCQIFLRTTYQMTAKYTKWPRNIPNSHKIYQMATKYTK
jgi:hypothetical protein